MGLKAPGADVLDSVAFMGNDGFDGPVTVAFMGTTGSTFITGMSVWAVSLAALAVMGATALSVFRPVFFFSPKTNNGSHDDSICVYGCWCFGQV